ncbi:unnamed protein product [Hymenolepis diminuta]|uniref:MARVEL domain-containing protein n=1 Tax=Hymenolepis diminuta TaxID=6216 RepID=A0A0R3S8A7_HYMDI|nr:unnamed protein product [Hymenolepis diminuta]VUZ46393.1 unnamed protein product [Hymenolepis diminuta]
MMDQKILHIFIALLTVFFICLVLSYHGWRCNGNLFSGECGKQEHMKITGYLLLITGIFSCISATLVYISMLAYRKWLEIAVVITTIITAILALFGVFYYYYHNHEKYLSPLISSAATTLSFVFMGMMIMDLLIARLDSASSPSFT